MEPSPARRAHCVGVAIYKYLQHTSTVLQVRKRKHSVSSDTIDHITLSRLVEARAVRGAQVVGQPGGWGIIVKYGMTERPLAATRSREVRVFKKLETLVGYLKEIGISRFDVDAGNFDPRTVKTYSRPDASEALKRAHGAAAHDKWFRAEVAKGVEEADDSATVWVSHEDARASWAKKRADLLRRAEPAGS